MYHPCEWDPDEIRQGMYMLKDADQGGKTTMFKLAWEPIEGSRSTLPACCCGTGLRFERLLEVLQCLFEEYLY